MTNLKMMALGLVLVGSMVWGHGNGALAQSADPPSLRNGFQTPPDAFHPETWFHLIGGNVNRSALTTDLEAVRDAGLGGIQLFHGRGRSWPGVTPQIQTLSPTWDSLIEHVADETRRLNLKFTMQNCPGWAMSGGPWITPENAMRHLVQSRVEVIGGELVELDLPTPQPSREEWRDYRDIAVLAFPTPVGDTDAELIAASIRSHPEDPAWTDWLAGKDVKVTIPASGRSADSAVSAAADSLLDTPAWLEVTFDEPTTLRSIELPPIEILMKRRNFDPDSKITVSVAESSHDQDNVWRKLVTHVIPRGNWQDRQPEVHYVLAVPDSRSARYRIDFDNRYPMEISHLRFSTAARIQDWPAQAGYALRSMERASNVSQSPRAWVAQDTIVDLTGNVDALGRLNWQSPPGNWSIVRWGHVNTGVTNKPAPPEATGFECDKFSTAGAEQHFAGYIGRLSQPGGAADGGRLRGMLIDSWECYTQTWTPKMEDEFQTRRGYSLRPWMPALAGWVVNDHASSERFLRDWRATISDLIVENYYGRLAELGRERGLQLSFETSVGDVSPGDVLQYYKSADIPMCETWQPNDPHEGGLETKPIATTASAAHIYGKNRVASESFTSAPMSWREHPFSLKNVADRSFALGVTHLVFHTYTHNPLDLVPGTSFGNSIGTPFLRGQTWWKHMPDFVDYLSRCGFMLEQGHPVADVLWYLGDDVDHKPRQDTAFPSGYHFDYLNADALLTRLSVDDGDLTIPEGNRWKVLWLPKEQCERMTPTTLQKIRQIVAAGATVIGEAPRMNPSLSGGDEADRKFESLVKELWGERSGSRDVSRGDRRIGKGRLLWGDDLETSLDRLEIGPDVDGTLPERWCHRRVGETDIYFIISDLDQPLDANLHFRSHGTPQWWNPIDGSTTPVTLYQTTDQGTTVPVRLPASGSTFLVFQPKSITGINPIGSPWQRIEFDGRTLIDVNDASHQDTTAGFPAFGLPRMTPIQAWRKPKPVTCEMIVGDSAKGPSLMAWHDGEYRIRAADNASLTMVVEGTRSIALPSGWTLTFPSGWDTPATMQWDNVGPWSDANDDAVRHFSGTATYQTRFTLDSIDPQERFLLDLGRVGDIAAVEVNGQNAGTLWTAPYRHDISAHVKSGENTLSIAVTNCWHNRLVYDAKLPRSERKTWTHAAPAGAGRMFAGLSDQVMIHVGRQIPLPTAD